jgi:hypothetical protein
MPASAKVNLATLALNATDLNSAITRGTIGDITPQRLGSSTATEAVFEAIVPPHTGTAYTGRTFEFTVEGEVYTHPLPNTFNFVSNKAYGYVLTLQERGAPLDMSADDGLANCYIVAPGGTSDPISIKRAITVGGMNVLTTNANITLEPLWDDGDVIESINPLTPATGNNRTFTVAVANNAGNAVIALKVGGIIYWSWHIWVTDNIQTFTNNGYEIMDRNLGATENTYTPASYGLYYQWGRKDPFPGALAGTPGYERLDKFHGLSDAPDTGPYYITGTGEPGTKAGILKSIRYPTTFYAGGNWLPTKISTLWLTSTATKSVYDPCPDPWQIPSVTNDGYNKGITQTNNTPYYDGTKLVGMRYMNYYFITDRGYRSAVDGGYIEKHFDISSQYGLGNATWTNWYYYTTPSFLFLTMQDDPYGIVLSGSQPLNHSKVPAAEGKYIRCVKLI